MVINIDSQHKRNLEEQNEACSQKEGTVLMTRMKVAGMKQTVRFKQVVESTFINKCRRAAGLF